LAKMKMAECPACGWAIKTPKGEDDVVKHVRIHAEDYHPEMKGVSRQEIVKMIKEV